jgi:predicted TIM-barrel fold metal-dependent hydrolase
MPASYLVRVALIAGLVASLQLAPYSCAQQPDRPASVAEGFNPAELQRFAAIHPIDAHTHIYRYTPEYTAFLSKLHMHTLDIMVVSDNANPERKDLAKESRDVFEIVGKSDHQVFACTTFDAYKFDEPGFAQNAIRGLNEAFAQGAVAAKEWKNFGMQVKNTKGQYVLPDDPALKPIYRDIAAHHKTLIMHIADPDTAWRSPDPKALDQSYFIEHPEWYMYKIPGSPTKKQILDARDHVVRDNPDLKVVGAHLGSMEADLAGLAADLDRYPNFAADLTARMPYLMQLPRAQAIAFFTRYQDKLIYGTDETLYPENNVQTFIRSAENTYASDWRFLSTDVQISFRGIQTQGLALPESILRKIFHDNAMRWYPGLQ